MAKDEILRETLEKTHTIVLRSNLAKNWKKKKKKLQEVLQWYLQKKRDEIQSHVRISDCERPSYTQKDSHTGGEPHTRMESYSRNSLI